MLEDLRKPALINSNTSWQPKVLQLQEKYPIRYSRLQRKHEIIKISESPRCRRYRTYYNQQNYKHPPFQRNELPHWISRLSSEYNLHILAADLMPPGSTGNVKWHQCRCQNSGDEARTYWYDVLPLN
ncbi:hypothetical protein JTB14_026502 [Gonioctena quinquepunctata]|nr:hypothetical protein JTB14_026502 [Gonioctena quinquepunctata]